MVDDSLQHVTTADQKSPSVAQTETFLLSYWTDFGENAHRSVMLATNHLEYRRLESNKGRSDEMSER